jgi:hypothetical protein
VAFVAAAKHGLWRPTATETDSRHDASRKRRRSFLRLVGQRGFGGRQLFAVLTQSKAKCRGGLAFSSAGGVAAGVRLAAVGLRSWLTRRTTEYAQEKADRMLGRILRLGPPVMPGFGGAESRGLSVHFAGWVSL